MPEVMCIELRLLVDRCGDFGIGRDGESASADYDDQVGGDRTAMREFTITLTVPLPVIEEVNGDVPELPVSPVTLTVS